MGTWDVSRVTDMSRLFHRRMAFNDPGIGAWDVSSVTTMQAMFSLCSQFSQDLNTWDTSSVKTSVEINVSRPLRFETNRAAFYGASSTHVQG